MSAGQACHHADAFAVVPLCTAYTDNLIYRAVELGSRQLCQAIHNVGPPNDCPRPPLTFDEQLAAVERGARIVEVIPIRKADPDYTLGGVCW